MVLQENQTGISVIIWLLVYLINVGYITVFVGILFTILNITKVAQTMHLQWMISLQSLQYSEAFSTYYILTIFHSFALFIWVLSWTGVLLLIYCWQNY